MRSRSAALTGIEVDVSDLRTLESGFRGVDDVIAWRQRLGVVEPAAVALLASGQNSSITGTLAGQIVMEGFVHIKLKPWLRRLITRSLAIIPTIIVVAVTGESGTENLVLFSGDR